MGNSEGWNKFFEALHNLKVNAGEKLEVSIPEYIKFVRNDSRIHKKDICTR